MDGTHCPASRMYCGQLPGAYGTHVDFIAKEFLYILSRAYGYLHEGGVEPREVEYLAARCVPRTADDASHSGVAGLEPSFLATGAKEMSVAQPLLSSCRKSAHIHAALRRRPTLKPAVLLHWGI